MPDFWRNCGFHLLGHDAAGRLVAGDDFLRACLARPEMLPLDESCEAERCLHRSLLDAPRRSVADTELARLADADARDNYRVFLAFRQRLLATPSIEACYLALMREGNRDVAPLFVDQMVQLVLRNLLEGCDDPLRLRAAELFFRTQRVNFSDSGVLVADARTIDMHASGAGFGSIGRLLAQTQTPVRAVSLDVLDRDNAQLYWLRDQAFDTAIALSFGRAALAALCRVMESWVRHLLGVEVGIEPLARIDEQRWAWHIGLDREAMALLNDLYGGADIEPQRLQRLIALFRLDFREPEAMRVDIAGRPVYLALAADARGELRLKPQNLILNLPLAGPE